MEGTVSEKGEIFFKNSKRICHIGLVIAYNTSIKTITTIEGNTSSAFGGVAKGVWVAQKTYLVNLV